MTALLRLLGLPAAVLGRIVRRRPDPDDAWAEDIIGWIHDMQAMSGTRSLRRPLPYSPTPGIGSAAVPSESQRRAG